MSIQGNRYKGSRLRLQNESVANPEVELVWIFLLLCLLPPFFSSYAPWTGIKRTKNKHCIVCILQENIITVAHHHEKTYKILKKRTIIMNSGLEIFLLFYSLQCLAPVQEMSSINNHFLFQTKFTLKIILVQLFSFSTIVNF